jgi:hypothetical protein
MSLIIIARFDSLPAAASAAHALVTDGFHEEAVSVFRAGDNRMSGRRGERWPGRLVYAAMARTAALAAAGAAVGATVSALMGIPDAYGVGITAVGALVGSLASTLLVLFERHAARRDGSVPPQAAFVAVIAEPGEEVQSAQLLRDAGGQGIERVRSRHLSRVPVQDEMRTDGGGLRTGLSDSMM